MKKPMSDVLYQEESSYKDMLLRKSMKMRIMETVAFVFGMMILAQFFPSDATAFKVLAFAIAIAVVGLSPFLYKAILRPMYKLTKTHLIISLSGEEKSYPLNEVEPIYEGRHVYRLSGKRESLMVSRQFLSHLNERLFYYQKGNKKRR
ncbi:hypothetical protein T458_13925 [Brevibacillus panacihumi W25]|uniref:Uncharacterized protein n=1 Tax=Brevibacillus panacihumi W25 TaxID=1408254 RepID=V6M931_9BACL|nr:hypothetical protein [Brevibacillus panacihumi]EST54395.1 hypothetical protein T458_13925 [Brevibacillus panacihumi W25]